MFSCALEFQMTRFDRLQNLRRRLITKWPVSRCPTNRLIGYLAARENWQARSTVRFTLGLYRDCPESKAASQGISGGQFR